MMYVELFFFFFFIKKKRKKGIVWMKLHKMSLQTISHRLKTQKSVIISVIKLVIKLATVFLEVGQLE